MGTRISYLDEHQRLEGYLSAPDSVRNLPGVLVVPSWLNVTESICSPADRLADAGYAAFVVDLFGAGVRPRPPQLPMEVVGPFLKDRSQFRRRVFAGFEAFRHRQECNPERIAAIGYCLGGCGVLELARAGPCAASIFGATEQKADLWPPASRRCGNTTPYNLKLATV